MKKKEYVHRTPEKETRSLANGYNTWQAPVSSQVDKQAFLELYCRAEDSVITSENIQNAWKNLGLNLFCLLVVPGALEQALLSVLQLSILLSNNVRSCLTS